MGPGTSAPRASLATDGCGDITGRRFGVTEKPDARLPITAAVLVGSDATVVVSLVESLQGACEEVVVVTLAGQPIAAEGLPPAARLIAAEGPAAGPLDALASAMEAARNEWVLAISAGGSRLEPELIAALWARRDGFDAVVCENPGGSSPVPALYRVATCLPAAQAALATGRHRLAALLLGVKVGDAPAAAMPPLAHPPASGFLGSALTPGASAAVRVDVTVGRARPMPSERPITIFLNAVEVATTQATPRDLEELAAGFLVAEGLIRDRKLLVSIDADAARGLVYVVSEEVAPEDLAVRARYLTSGCGGGVTFASVGHARGMSPVVSELTVSATQLYALVGEMAHAAIMYQESGGVHACGLARGGRLLFVREDVGRHNAVDKLLGRAWLDDIPTSDAVLISTGRISYEMAVKAAKAAVPIVATRSAVTDLAADIGDELGITLVGYVRGKKLTVYTHPERVLAPEGD